MNIQRTKLKPHELAALLQPVLSAFDAKLRRLHVAVERLKQNRLRRRRQMTAREQRLRRAIALGGRINL